MKKLYHPFIWDFYSKEMKERILDPLFCGVLREEDLCNKGMRLVIGEKVAEENGERLVVYLAVDEEDGMISDAKFQCFGPTILVGGGEIVCDLVMRKTHDQAGRISAHLIENEMCDPTKSPPQEMGAYANFILEVLDEALFHCKDLPFAETYETTPLDRKRGEKKAIEGFAQFSEEKKLSIIRRVIDEEIRPYVELDAGGVEVLEIKQDHQVIIAYQGACTSCYAATGSTLSAIENILQTSVDPSIRVTPDLSNFQPGL